VDGLYVRGNIEITRHRRDVFDVIGWRGSLRIARDTSRSFGSPIRFASDSELIDELYVLASHP